VSCSMVEWIARLSDAELVAEINALAAELEKLAYEVRIESLEVRRWTLPLSDDDRRVLRAWLSHRHVTGLYKRDCEITRALFAAKGVG